MYWVETLFYSGAWFLGLLCLFYALERLWPSIPQQRFWRKGATTDLIYWFVMPFVYNPIKLLFITLGVFVIAGDNNPVTIRQMLLEGHGALAALPLWQQFILALALSDIVQYWMHRAFHKRQLWSFHAIHHAPREIDWLSSVRFHPVNFIVSFTTMAAALVVLGFAPAALAALQAFNAFYSSFVHANVNWTFGPFRYVLASPIFHRWHHTSVREGGNKNFAPTFPILDVIFGTFYMPDGKSPHDFGVAGNPVPENFLGQMRYPFAA